MIRIVVTGKGFIFQKNSFMLKKITCIALLGLALLSGCSDDQKPSDETPAPSESADAATGTENKKPRAEIKLVLTGGNFAGTYNATCTDACCSYGIADKNTFGNQYSETGKGEKELSSVQLIVEDVTGDKSTDEFMLTVTIGDFMNEKSTSYTLNTRKKGTVTGSGKIDLKYSNNKATVKIKGKTADGVGIDLDMECFRVITPETILDK